MPRNTRAQAKRNAVPVPTALPTDLPAPSTSRNLVPRSRATSLARSASRSLPGSSGSSRRSSLSGARSGDSARHLEASLSASRPPTPSGTISETGPPTDSTAYSGGRSQVLGPSGADTPVEGPSSVPQSQEPSSRAAVQQRRSSPTMFHFYDFDGSNSGQGEQPGHIGNNFQGQTDNGWYPNGHVDDAPQQPGFFPFDGEDAFAMRQNLSLGANGNSNTMHNGFAPSPAPVASSSSMHRSPSHMPQFQSTNGMNMGPSEMSGLWYRENTDRQLRSLAGPTFGHSSMAGPQNNQQGYYSGDIIPPSPPEEREMYYHFNHPANNRWPPSRPVHLAHTFDPWNTQASMDYMGSANSLPSMNPGPSMRPMTSIADSIGLRQQTPPEPSGNPEYMGSTASSLSMNLQSVTGPSMRPMTSTGLRQQTPPQPSGNPTHVDSLSDGYPSDTMPFASLNQWQPMVGGPSTQGATSGSTSGKRKRSPEDGSPAHPSSSHFVPSLRPAGDPSSQGSGRDSANEVAEQLFYSNGNNGSQPHPDPNSAGPSSQQSSSTDRKGKGKARAHTPATAPSIIDITDSPPADRPHRPPAPAAAEAADTQNGLDAENTGRRAKPPAEGLASYTCPICFCAPTNAAITPCGHICCGACLFAAVKTTLQRAAFGMGPRPSLSEARCPVCRAAIPGWDGKGGGVIGLKVRAVFSL